MIGTRGVPARYGGFETCVEEVGRRLVERGHRVTVYSRRQEPAPGRGEHRRGECQGGECQSGEYRGMRVITLPALRRKSLETLSRTALSVVRAPFDGTDVAFVFNAANAPLLPVLRAGGIPVVTHVDGIEWRRAKWGKLGRRYYRIAESLAVRWSNSLIADAHGIADYYRERFGVETTYIPYGAPRLCDADRDAYPARLAELGLRPSGYHLVVARFEPENHVHLAVSGYRRSSSTRPLVVVGSAPYAGAYTERIRQLAAGDDRIRLLGPVWDQSLLDALYAHALTYIHGHSVGGTNPSLLRAMGAGTATTAFDVTFNREVLAEYGHYFRDARELAAHCETAESDEAATRSRGLAQLDSLHRYDWNDVAERYARLASSVRTPERTSA